MVSIIVPVYNVEKYIQRCVDSILEQNYQDLELILVDDGSPDNCGAICDGYAKKDSRVHVIHKKNGGVSSARNAGLDQANGEYVTFCDSDDFYEPQWIEKLIAAMESCNADVVRANSTFFHDDIAQNSVCYGECGSYELHTPEERISYCFTKLFGGKHGWSVWERLFRVSIIREHNIHFCESCGNFAEDMGFVLEYTLHCSRVISVREAGYMYYQRDGSMMQSSQGSVKLDCVHEVSRYFCRVAEPILGPKLSESVLPIFHFFIMFNQYQAMLLTQEITEIQELVDAIPFHNEWEARTRQIFTNEESLRKYLGKRKTKWVLRVSRSCLTGDWKRIQREYKVWYQVDFLWTRVKEKFGIME